MAYELTQKCIDLPALDMSAKEKLVLISLARFADDSGKCFPSLPTLERVPVWLPIYPSVAWGKNFASREAGR